MLPAAVEVNPDVLFQTLDGADKERPEAVLLHLKTEKYYGLDDVASRMWQLLAETCDPEATVARLLTEYTVDESRLRKDLAAFIDKMVAAQLLVIPPAPPQNAA
jgi:hypothetical protein